MAKVYLNKNGDYEFNVMIKGVRYHKSYKGLSKSEVEDKLAELRIFVKQNPQLGNKPKCWKLSELIADYNNYKNIHYSRPDELNYVINTFLRILGDINAEEITRSDIEKYIITRQYKVKNSTINREMDNIRRIFSLAYENKKISYNPCAKIKKLRIENPKERFLTREEEEKLLLAANPIMKAIITVAVDTGLRQNELLSLKWEDLFFDSNNPYIYVRKTKNNTPRIVGMTNRIKDILIKLEKYSEYVFTSPVTLSKYRDIKSTFNRTVIKAGIEPISFHKLRHTTASRLNEAGVDIVTIQEILGHRNLETTRRYAHSSERQKIDAIKKLEGIN